MACFTVPAAEAIVTTIAGKIIKSKEKHQTVDASKNTTDVSTPKIPFSTKIGWLNKMLWGGSALLAFEHVWHGEVVPFFPFLTAVKNGEAAEMLHEMATAGVSMALLVTAVWGIMVGVVSIFEKHANKSTGSATLAGGLA
ncbi:MAG: hypothetical protein IKX70_00590 [Treponema sp.]|nr:hypothetical protein [Treponema sp.]